MNIINDNIINIINNKGEEEIICPKCGSKAIAHTDVVLTSNPPMYNVDCPKCGRIYMFCSDVNEQLYPDDPIKEAIKNNLSLDVRNDLKGNRHICLLYEGELLSNINIDEAWTDTQNSNA